MKNLLVVAVAVSLIIFFIGPAMADPSSVLYVKPTTGVGTGPYVITSPATLKIGVKASAASEHNTITKIWLILVLNEDTWAHLTSITTTITAPFSKNEFRNPDLTGESKIPVASAATGRTWYGDTNYPGCEQNEQYSVGGLKGNMYGSETGTIYYFIKEITITQITKDNPATFTLTVNTDPGVTELKVMVLAMGYSLDLDDNDGNITGELNECTSLSEYTFVVPEIAPVLLALASIGGLGIYTYKQKKGMKNIA